MTVSGKPHGAANLGQEERVTNPTVADERRSSHSDGAWLIVLRRYLVFVAGANLVWEVLQLPLYTIWQEANAPQLAFAVLHCTGGDKLIAVSSLALALILAADRAWPTKGFAGVAALATMFGVSYTMFSEWLNIVVRKSWAYSKLMPMIPGIGAGLSPLAQWVVIPLAGFWWAHLRVAPIGIKSRASG